MNKLFAIAVSLFIIILMNRCTAPHHLCQSTNFNTTIDTTNILHYDKIVSVMKNNFFYSKKDSTYIQNFNIFETVLYNEHYFTMRKLTQKEFIHLFGEPHFRDSTKLGYIVKKALNAQGNENILVQFFLFRNGIYKDLHTTTVHKDKEVDKSIKFVFGQNKNNICLKNIVSRSIKLENSNVSELCKVIKKDFEKDVYYDKINKIFILNCFSNDFPITSGNSCDNTFTKQEIISLFGNPHMEKQSDLFYKLSNTPFYQTLPNQNKDNDGKVLCIYFHKLESTELYQFETTKYEEIK